MEEYFGNELVKKFEEMMENNDEFYFDTEELEDIIVYYLELGDFNYADMAVNFGLKLHPNSLDIKIKKLEILLEWEEYNTAKELINELKGSSMEHTDFLVCYAKYYSNLGNPRKSIEICKRALELGEEENFLHNFIADEYVNLGDPFNALKHYRKALKEDPSDEYALENCMVCFSDLNKSEEAIAFLNEYLDEFSYSETAWFEYGQFYFNRKNFEEAIKGYDYLLAINSSSVGVYANKAACYEALGQYQKSIEVYEEMLELEYTKAFTFYKIGLCHKALKQPILALNSFQKSLREDPQFYLAMMEQSYLYEEMGGMSEALHFAKEATQLNENNLDYQKRLAFLFIDSGKFEESLSCLKKLVADEPSRFYNWYAYSEVLMLLGEYEEAVTVLNAAIKKHYRAELFYQLSNCFFNLKEKDKGMDSLQKALDLDPSLAKDMQKKYPFIKDEVKKVKASKVKKN
ncbi:MULTISPECIES: tetratricopeptide repeat protein [Chryseobacterium]|uniref:Tetratricopeptide (TPR) repeat protein n=1 Tax=Chryseobacterium rhizosphaerae TaxID=395937 RepID=A0AAE4C368_9FLAO|nr:MULTISPECIES: tetratricopeptide repeat protein [Chryseobacterium]MBL3549631.1 tetratricopeptide repeat protein [Chryseobacterium sp. KMC2]MDC8102507.1 tetratricopeptide repeat protein [Chryseobacterium rhizosphaerae]MDR6526577.1 tetratricopeptide (TPR) repeat protein [Chryseobacterium rhizosphaerae]MDR6548723.1 tetratricopeptide (TPR) repeat protein [Chryseobacterium rhizosphaerae]REC77834.1 tetratricopeptide repeat protein [Chryseobacterium rhizosphaerae]